MATTYYYTAFLQEGINGTWSTVYTSNIDVNLQEIMGLSATESNVTVQWVIKAYSYDTVTQQSTQLSGSQVKVNIVGDWAYFIPSVSTETGYYTAATSTQASWSQTLYSSPSKKLVVKPSIQVRLPDSSTNFPWQQISQTDWDALTTPGGWKGSPPTAIQTLTVTQAQASKPIPDGLVKALNPNGYLGAEPDLTGAKWDQANQQWVAKVPSYKNGKTTYTMQYWTGGSKGTLVKAIQVGTDSTGKKKADDLLIQAVNGKKSTVALLTKKDGGGTSPKVTGSAPPANPDLKARYNPPTHVSTRRYTSGLKMEALQAVPGYSYNSGADLPGSIGQNFQRVEVNPSIFSGGKLGKIVQDPGSAAVVNTKEPKKLWGFRYTYNPTTIQYQVQGNTSVDWTLSSNDPAALLAGNIQVNFQLYLNRIADMTQLKTNPNQGYGQPALIQEQIDGILNRGTEYDIEYLYRVCNGDPDTSLGKNPMLTYNGTSSDVGILKMLPVWLYVNDNMKLFGSVASINVSHAMFTLDMIPILSTVDITFTRYPAIFNIASTNSSDGSGQAGFAAAIGGALVGNTKFTAADATGSIGNGG